MIAQCAAKLTADLLSGLTTVEEVVDRSRGKAKAKTKPEGVPDTVTK